MDIGLLVIRVVVGALLVGHGTQKLFGWFGGYGPEGTGGYFESLGYRQGRPLALLAGLGEAGGGGLLALGFLTPLAAVGIIGVMLNAIVAQHLGRGPWVTEGGWELPLTYAAIGSGFAFVGPGTWSVDAAIGWTIWGWTWGVAATALGVLAAASALGARSAPQQASVSEDAEEAGERRAA